MPGRRRLVIQGTAGSDLMYQVLLRLPYNTFCDQGTSTFREQSEKDIAARFSITHLTVTSEVKPWMANRASATVNPPGIPGRLLLRVCYLHRS